MSNLTIRNLDDVQDLDRQSEADVRGGLALPGLGDVPLQGLSNVLASVNSANVTQNPINILMGGSGGAGDTANTIGSLTLTPVNVSSPVTVVQGALPSA